jgi:hypothetical protein
MSRLKTRKPRLAHQPKAATRRALPDKFDLYEMAVQSPKTHVAMFEDIYQSLKGKNPYRLREDFCGTFGISAAWVNKHPKHTAIAVDLDGATLKRGLKGRAPLLTIDQKKRLDVRRGNVLSERGAPADIVSVCNFSFYIFKTRQLLKRYFAAALKNLKKDGIIVLEMVGGAGMMETTKDWKTIRRKGVPQFSYVWDQKSFDPVTANAHYAIHFKFKGKKMMRDQFEYDWRLWSIPEVRELLREAGFKKSVVLWEQEVDGEGTGEYLPVEKGENDYSWCAYIVGFK